MGKGKEEGGKKELVSMKREGGKQMKREEWKKAKEEEHKEETVVNSDKNCGCLVDESKNGWSLINRRMIEEKL